MNNLKTKFRLWHVCVLFIFFVLSGLPAYADLVMPSSRVTSHLNVRQQPDVNSPVVGTLSPGESAKLAGSVPHWYRVTLVNGTQGFVSKAWAQVVSGVLDAEKKIRVGSWNIKKLGHNNPKDFPLVAKIINSNFDILAVVEVMQKQGGHPGYEALLSELGSGWSGLVTDTPRPNTNAGHAEYYAILYRSALVRTCEGWNKLIYHVDNDGSENGAGDDHFSREPAFGCFEVPVDDGSIGFDFLIAAYHARWADGKVSEISAEVGHLGEVFAAMEAARPGERDIFIAGDFNLVPDDLQQVIAVSDRTKGSGSTLNNQGERTNNLYDHFLVLDLEATSEMIDDPEVLDVRGVAANDKTYFNTVSDHLPIFVKMRCSGPDDD